MRAGVVPGDYHVHTTFSDGEGSVVECVRHAISLGLPEIGLADHLSPVQPTPWDERVDPVRASRQLRGRRSTTPSARIPRSPCCSASRRTTCPARRRELAAVLAAYPFEFVIGGVHVVDGFEFDDPARRDDLRWADADALFIAYYDKVRRAAKCGRFDVIAHLDYIGLWGHAPAPRGGRARRARLSTRSPRRAAPSS